jgi:IS605 OrfB family transposase
MLVQKTVVARVWKPTRKKRERLEEIFDLWRGMLKLKSYKERRNLAPDLHSAYARNCFKAKSFNDPVYLAHYDFKIKETGNRLANWFVRIPYKPREPIWLPIRFAEGHEGELKECEIEDSRLIRDEEGFKLHITIAKKVELHAYSSSVLGVDLGERFLAVAVLLRGSSAPAKPKFYGKSARGVRRHYSWLRKRLGERKLLRTIRKIAHSEKRKINTLCHQISRAIVDEAKANDAVIVLGDLKGIRKRAKGRRFNRIVSSMPYYKLSKYIEYKALWDGIPVVYAEEAYSSRECHFCHSEGKRPTQGLFTCPACGHQYNADYNGAYNIARRFWEYSFQNGALGSAPLREAENDLPS